MAVAQQWKNHIEEKQAKKKHQHSSRLGVFVVTASILCFSIWLFFKKIVTP